MKIRVYLIYDVKYYKRHKTRCVADVHLKKIPFDSVYSGVISLRGLHMMIALTELNQLDIWATDIGNVYLEARTPEKVYITAGQEFGKKQENALIIYKELYGLRSSGIRWYDKLSDNLRDIDSSHAKQNLIYG